MNELKILIVYDIDIQSSNKISEKYVCNNNNLIFDCCILIGSFNNFNIKIKEEETLLLGNISSIIAQFENIICRVIYLCSYNDPITAISSQLCLTPNSININSRSLPLIDGLYIAGYTENENVLSVYSSNEDSDDETMGFEVQTSTSVKIINEVLVNAPSYAYPNIPTSLLSGIFLLNYKYVHTLNHFLFFQSELLQSSNVKLAIIPTASTTTTTTEGEENEKSNIKLPRQLRGLTIVSPPSLRLTGGYSIVTYRKVNNNFDNFVNNNQNQNNTDDNNNNNNNNTNNTHNNNNTSCWEIYQVEDLYL